MTIASDATERSSGRILFLCPDATTPYGGIKAMYQMVDVLVESGFDAYIWHASPRTEMSWFPSQTPVLAEPKLRLQERDVLVVPEMLGPNYARTASRANVVILNQNHFHVFRGAGLQDDWPGTYPGWPNAVAVITTSRAIRNFVDFLVRDEIPVFDLSYWIDSRVFTPGEKQSKIVVLTRRRRTDLVTIVQLLRRSSFLHDWDVLPVDGLAERELAELLGTARIFISLSNREGLGLPPAEAMASGCYVIGFTGDGGREFMLPEFCSPVEDQNLLEVLTEVERAAGLWAAEPLVMSQKVKASRDFVLTHFSYERFRTNLVSAFEELTRTGSPARQQDEFYLTHYSAIKPPSNLEKLLSRTSPLIPAGMRRYWRHRRKLGRST